MWPSEQKTVSILWPRSANFLHLPQQAQLQAQPECALRSMQTMCIHQVGLACP